MSDDKAQEELAYLEEWLRGFAVARELAPGVQRRYEATKLNAETFDYLKARVPDEVAKALVQSQARETAELMRRLPLIPIYDQYTATALAVGSTSTATGIKEALIHVNESESPPNPQGILLFKAHERLYQEHNQFAEAESLQERVFQSAPGLLNLFRAAEKSFRTASAGVGDKHHAAGDLRNFLEKLKGELLDKARQHERENMTWSKMVPRLTPSATSAQHTRLIERERFHNDLYDELSKLTKLQRDINGPLLSSLWMRVVDHVIVVCGCIFDRSPPP